MIGTITLDTAMNYTDALQYLIDGKCIGIKPQNNLGFIVKYKPIWMKKTSPDYQICWSRSFKDGQANEGIRAEQYLGDWFPVVIDTNTLPENIKQSFILENITGLLPKD